MCSSEPTAQVEEQATIEGPFDASTAPLVKFIDGEGNEIEPPEGFSLRDVLAELLFGSDPADPDSYLLSNTETGQRAFEYDPAGVPNGGQPTITFELFQIPSGKTVAGVKFDAAEIATAQEHIENDPKFIEAGAPSGALLFEEAPLRALAQIATEFADEVAAANAVAEETTAGNPAPEIPPVLLGGPDA